MHGDSMITYLTVFFSTDGAPPSEVVDRLYNIGFKPTGGNYDFIYEWDSKATLDDALHLGDQIHNVLEGMGVFFKMETRNGDF